MIERCYDIADMFVFWFMWSHHLEIMKCPDGFVCGEAPFNDQFSPTYFCGERFWQPFWVNVSISWNKDYIKRTAKKTVIL